MYPQRIHRFILDGVFQFQVPAHGKSSTNLDLGNVEIVDYTKNLWLTAVETTEDALHLFFHHCARVGPAGCAFAEEGMTAANISTKFERVMETLRHNPLPVFGPDADVVDYSGTLGGLFVSLYSPLRTWPYMAKLLQAINVGIDDGHMTVPNLTVLSATMGHDKK
jgi:hypothetical protein